MKKKMLLIIAIFVLISTSSFLIVEKNKPKDIHKVLETKAYSYLPNKAKEFVEKVYQETGEIVLTEKNKKENEPYLNPLYVEYLELDEEEKKQVTDIPIAYALEPVNLEVDGAEIPASYDLRSVDGKNYTTPTKNQETLDLCWAFTSTEQIESYNMIKKGIGYNKDNSLVLSPRQMDYATSTDGIRGYTNPDGVRNLTEGGNFLSAENVMVNGLSLTKDSIIPFTTSKDLLELETVLNYDNSEFELNSSEVYINNNFTPGTTNYNNFILKVKQNIMKYGGAYVSTQAPGYSCASYNAGSQIIRVDDDCTHNAGHAMQIIGWKDDYSYSYCKSTCTTSGSTETYKCHDSANSCDSSNLVTGTGAWLLRNSWGSSYSYVYLAYDSPTAAMFFTTGISEMKNRTWDNNYRAAISFTQPEIGAMIEQSYTKDLNTVEKVEKVKFHTFGQNGTYKISVLSKSKNYLNVATIKVAEIGYATVDLSPYNIYIADPTFTVRVTESSGTVKIINKSISVFTSNYDEIPLMEASHYYSDYTTDGYQIEAYTLTKNIPSGTEITYALFDDKGNDVSSHISYQYNHVAINNLNTLVYLDGTLEPGMYTLKYYYNGNEYLSKMIIGIDYSFTGSGTVDDPFLIYNEDDLRKMSIYMDGHYRLENDIVLEDNWVPIGNNTAPFIGSLDGNGHTIENLVVPATEKNGGLFGYVKAVAENTTSIKNLTIKNANVEGQESSGILIGAAEGVIGYQLGDSWVSPSSTLTLDSIYIIGGKVYSNNGSAGSLIGSIEGTGNQYVGKHTYTINKIFTSAEVGGKKASGLIGSVNGGLSSTYKTNLTLTNIENLGSINVLPLIAKGITPQTGTHAAIVGTLNNYNDYQLRYYIVSPLFRGVTYESKGLLGTTSTNTITSTTSGYSTLTTPIANIKNANNYNSWTNFYNNWKIESPESIARIPILKDVDFEYTTLSNIEMGVGETISYQTLLSSTNLSRLVADVADNTIASVENQTDEVSGCNVNVVLHSLKTGQTTIHFVSNYDGYENTILVKSGVPITDFTIEKTSIGIDIGDTYLVSYTILPDNTTDTTVVTWTSNDDSIATVEDGMITGIGYGTTTVTGTLANGMNVSIEVTVRKTIPMNSFTVSTEKVKIHPNQTRTIVTGYSPTNTSDNTEITWTTSNPEVATINENTITGIAEGEAVITGSMENGKTITIQVIVTNEEFTLKKGDMNYDDVVNISDVVFLLRKVFKYLPIDDVDLSQGDLDHNGSINIEDVVKLLRYVFKYISELD